jgi:RHS repeat-associated protein
MPAAAPTRSRPPRWPRARIGGRCSRPPKLADPAPRTAISGRRYYSPSQGRFLGRDPKGEKGGTHLYAFVTNNPSNRWDYLGMTGWAINIGTMISPTTGQSVSTDTMRTFVGSDDVVEDGDWVLLGTDDPDPSRWFWRSRSDPANERPFEGSLGGSEPDRAKQLNDCYAAARAKYGADTAKLGTIADQRIESFFGSLAAQQSAARAGVGVAVATTVRDSAATIVGGYLVGTAAAAQWASAAAAGRNLYAAAQSARQVNAIASEVAALQTTANIVRSSAGTAFAIGYNVAMSGDASGAALGSATELVDFLAGNQFSQTGILVGLTQATLDYISGSGLSDAQASGVVSGIRASVSDTQKTLDNRLQSALSDCDQKFK